MLFEAKENRRHTKLFNKLSSILRSQALFSENVFFIIFTTTIVQNWFYLFKLVKVLVLVI